MDDSIAAETFDDDSFDNEGKLVIATEEDVLESAKFIASNEVNIKTEVCSPPEGHTRPNSDGYVASSEFSFHPCDKSINDTVDEECMTDLQRPTPYKNMDRIDDRYNLNENCYKQSHNSDLHDVAGQFVGDTPKQTQPRSREVRHKCMFCHKTFGHNKSLYKHMLTHTQESQNCCFVCYADFPNEQLLNAHLLTHQNCDYRCQLCQEGFSHRNAYLSHMKSHMSGRADTQVGQQNGNVSVSEFECEICHRTYTLKSSLNRHKKKHLLEQVYTDVNLSDNESSVSKNSRSTSKAVRGKRFSGRGRYSLSAVDTIRPSEIKSEPVDFRATIEQVDQNCYLREKGHTYDNHALDSHVTKFEENTFCDSFTRYGVHGGEEYSRYNLSPASSALSNSAGSEHLSTLHHGKQGNGGHFLCEDGENFIGGHSNRELIRTAHNSSAVKQYGDDKGLDLSLKSYKQWENQAHSVNEESQDVALDLSIKSSDVRSSSQTKTKPTSTHLNPSSCYEEQRNSNFPSKVKCATPEIVEEIAVDLSKKTSSPVVDIEMDLSMCAKRCDDIDSSSHYSADGHTESTLSMNQLVTEDEELQEIYKCKKCPQVFNDRFSLLLHNKDHQDTEEEDETQKCPYCPKIYQDKLVLNRHLLHHLKDLTLYCDFCCLMFIDKDKHAHHMNIHNNDSLYTCNVCSETFNERHFQLKHIKSHVGKKPYKCFECEKSFPFKSYLESHMRIHIDTKPFQCHICDRGFSHSFNLTKHLRIHTGEKPYKCSHCNRTFGQKNSLNRHLQLHVTDSPFSCKVCGKCFADETSVLSHQVTVHGIAHGVVKQEVSDTAGFSKDCSQSDMDDDDSDVDVENGEPEMDLLNNEFAENKMITSAACDLTIKREHEPKAEEKKMEENFVSQDSMELDEVSKDDQTSENSASDDEARSDSQNIAKTSPALEQTSPPALTNPYMAQAPPGLPYGSMSPGYPAMLMSGYMMHHMVAYQLALQQQRISGDVPIPEEIQQQATILMNYMHAQQIARQSGQETPSTYTEQVPADRSYVDLQQTPVGKEQTSRHDFQCQECGKTFKRRNYLRLHMRVHTGEKPFKCDVCGKCFSHSFNLTKHVRTHTGEQPYHCTVCNRRFSHANSLNRHMMLHTDQEKMSADRQNVAKIYNEKSYLQQAVPEDSDTSYEIYQDKEYEDFVKTDDVNDEHMHKSDDEDIAKNSPSTKLTSEVDLTSRRIGTGKDCSVSNRNVVDQNIPETDVGHTGQLRLLDKLPKIADSVRVSKSTEKSHTGFVVAEPGAPDMIGETGEIKHSKKPLSVLTIKQEAAVVTDVVGMSEPSHDKCGAMNISHRQARFPVLLS